MPLIDAICCRAFSRIASARLRVGSRGFIGRARNRSGRARASREKERRRPGGERERERETRDRPLVLARRSPASGSSSSSSGAPENRFSPLLESQAFARKRIPLIKRESRRTLRSSLVYVAYGLIRACRCYNRSAIFGDARATRGRDSRLAHARAARNYVRSRR